MKILIKIKEFLFIVIYTNKKYKSIVLMKTNK